MPGLLDSRSRAETVAAACNYLIAVDGLQGLTMRRIAGVCRLSPATLTAHFGSKAYLVKIAAHLTARERTSQIVIRTRREGAHAFLPGDDPDDVIAARCWLGWCELGRSEPTVEPVITDARQDHRALLARAVDYRLEREELDTAMALVDGLLVALSAPTDPLPVPRARRALAAHLARALPSAD